MKPLLTLAAAGEMLTAYLGLLSIRKHLAAGSLLVHGSDTEWLHSYGPCHVHVAILVRGRVT